MQLDALVAQVEARKDILALKIPYELLPVEVKALLQTAATELAASEGVTKVPSLLGVCLSRVVFLRVVVVGG